jgi:hypothetical protein
MIHNGLLSITTQLILHGTLDRGNLFDTFILTIAFYLLNFSE